MTVRSTRLPVPLAVAALLGTALLVPGRTDPRRAAGSRNDRVSAIVQSSSSARASTLVREVGGNVTHDLAIIDAVGADLTPAQMRTLESRGGDVRIYGDHDVKVASVRPPTYPNSWYPTIVGANRLHAAGITGAGVTVAILDTGFGATLESEKWDTHGRSRVKATYNAIRNQTGSLPDDKYGHGTHVQSVIMGSQRADDGSSTWLGVAPDAGLVAVQAFDETGGATYANVIRGLNWILANRARYGIRVLNCSFAAPARSRYWDDPIDQAIMKLWQAGVVVVVSAGNAGPNPMTVGVPGNVPYVITVGAMTDNYSPSDPTDDKLCSFSSTGPTTEGFVKPELVAPGGHILGLMEDRDVLSTKYNQYLSSNRIEFTMSGTSQAAAVVSGIVALMLQDDPTLTPDQVKFRLMNTARPFVKKDCDGETERTRSFSREPAWSTPTTRR